MIAILCFWIWGQEESGWDEPDELPGEPPAGASAGYLGALVFLLVLAVLVAAVWAAR